MLNQSTETKDAINTPFNEYTVCYYSQSSPLSGAVYINCFMSKANQYPIHVRNLLFTYANGSSSPGQENADLSTLPTLRMPESNN